ncbi:MAG TPA: hypothetical protein EYG17_09010 [Acidimicrobiia bacterium]|nr:hypothetical protein [Acidimicrobiia bacterium]
MAIGDCDVRYRSLKNLIILRAYTL